jgi:hypothetical protein
MRLFNCISNQCLIAGVLFAAIGGLTGSLCFYAGAIAWALCSFVFLVGDLASLKTKKEFEDLKIKAKEEADMICKYNKLVDKNVMPDIIVPLPPPPKRKRKPSSKKRRTN